MKSHFNFTKASIDALTPLNTQKDYSDIKVPGLQIRVYASGKRTYFLYRKVKGRPARYKIGRYTDMSLEQARKEAIRLNSVIALGGNPVLDRSVERAELTITELIDRYYNEYAIIHNKRPMDNKNSLDFHIVPVLGNRRLSEVSTSDVRALHLKIGETRGKGTSNRVIALLNSVYNFAAKQGYYKMANPCNGLQKFRTHSRDRFLSKEELKKFFDALKPEKQIFQDYFSLLLYTGARKSNVLAMKWADIDLDGCRWRIDYSEAKNNDVNLVSLSDQSLKILRRRKEEHASASSPYVFPGIGAPSYLKDPKKAFQRIKERMEVTDIRMHDLRRTLASYMAISGVSLPIIGAALNHKSHASTVIYARLAQAPVLDAVNIATKAISANS